MSKINSNQKGKAGERELAKALQEVFGVSCRRGQQFKGGTDSPDVVGLDGIHIECKRTETFQLYKALEQADSEKGDNIPVVCHRKNGKYWVAVVYLNDLPDLAEKIISIMKGSK